MTTIKKIKLFNFKRFAKETFEFNDDINIFVGDNDSGKSSLLEAIDLCLNGTHRGKPLSPELMSELFNNQCIDAYLQGNLAQDTLPELRIEVFVQGAPHLRGDNNIDGIDAEGICLRAFFDKELADSYSAFISNPDNVSTLPFEFYKTEWYGFHWDRITQHNRGINCLFVDPTRLHPTYGRSRYISSIINSSIKKNARAALNLNYRQLKQRFNDEEEVKAVNKTLDADKELTKKSLKIVADIVPTSSWESNLQLAVNDISFPQIGKGEQNQIQIKIAIQNKAKDVDIVMLEEPENHLSHINLIQLISYIEKKNEKKQIFITTHSSYVLNKLSIGKLCLLSKDYLRLNKIDTNTEKTLKRLPGYDTLRLVLAQKVILVEGPSDELLLKTIYVKKHKCLPEDNGIDIIVVRGIGFKLYLDIAKPLSHPVRVVKDNDGDYQKNIVEWMKDYADCTFIECYSPTNNTHCSLEPALVEVNGGNVNELDTLAKVMLSATTKKEFDKCDSLESKKQFMKDWFAGKDGGSKKVDSAVRIFDSDVEIKFPDYLLKAVTFATA